MKSNFPLIIALALGFATASAPRLRAVTIVDQIGSSGTFFTGRNAYTSQVFDDFPTFSISAVDDFSVSSIFNLTNVTAAMEGSNGFSSYGNITGYEVNIYSSLAAAKASLNGDIAHALISPASATVTTSFSGDLDSALVSLPVSILLPRTGTFYLSVLADLNFDAGGQLGIYGSTGLTGSNPGGANGHQENPGSGFGLPGNESAINADLAYRITANAVPEPSAYAMMVGAGLLLLGLRRARRGSIRALTT